MTGRNSYDADSDWPIRETVALGCRILQRHGHDDFIWGHLSARAPKGAWMKRAGLGFEEVKAEDVLLVGAEGEVLAGEGRRHSEWPIHTEVLAARPDVGAVIHTHPPYAIALGAANQPLRPFTHAGTLFVPPEIPRFDLTSNLIRERSEGKALADALGDAFAVFMVNHGVLVCGTTVEEAVVRAVMLESSCKQQVLATQAGADLVWPNHEESLEKREAAWPPSHITMLWEYLVRNHERAADSSDSLLLGR